MSTLREAAQQALEAFEAFDSPISIPAMTALKAALAEPPTNQCGETCERAKLCAVCARGLSTGDKLSPTDPVARINHHSRFTGDNKVKAYIVDWSSEGNIQSGTSVIQAESIVEAQDKFWEWLRKQPIYGHMWRLSFTIEESELI